MANSRVGDLTVENFPAYGMAGSGDSHYPRPPIPSRATDLAVSHPGFPHHIGSFALVQCARRWRYRLGREVIEDSGDQLDDRGHHVAAAARLERDGAAVGALSVCGMDPRSRQAR
jgi:hypothetical protein